MTHTPASPAKATHQRARQTGDNAGWAGAGTRLPNEDDPITLKEACDRHDIYSAQEIADKLGKTRAWVMRWAENYPEHGERCFLYIGQRKYFFEPAIRRMQETIEIDAARRKGARDPLGKVYFVGGYWTSRTQLDRLPVAGGGP